MKMNEATSLSLKIGIAVGLVLTVIGLLMQDPGEKILWLGLLILICSPLFGVIVTNVFLIKEKDWKWAKIATILILVITVGLIISLI